MINTFLDIETIPTQNPVVIADIKSTISAPAQYKKPESIEQWLEDHGAKEAEKKVAETSFNGGLGQIASISFAFDDEPVQGNIVLDTSLEGEARMLHWFNETMRNRLGFKQPYFIGHYIAGFDLKFLFHRMVIHKIKPAFLIPFNDAPYKNTYFDTGQEWAGHRERVSLDTICKYLGIESPKGVLDGSKVWEFIKAGRFADVLEYNKRDVETVRKVYKRLTFTE